MNQPTVETVGYFPSPQKGLRILPLILCLGYARLSHPASPTHPPPRPNLILVSIDTLRADRLEKFGGKPEIAPALNRLAREGTLFLQAHSTSSWTAPAHASAFTGLYPPSHRVDAPELRLPEDCPTLAGRLKDLGYATKAIISGPMVEKSFGFDRGFDDFDDRTYVRATDLGVATESVVRQELLLYNVRAADAIRAAAVKWLDSHPPEPWFLFLHFWDVHADYSPPLLYKNRYDPTYLGPIDGTIKSPFIVAGMPARDLEHLRALYDGDVSWTDSQIGLLADRLRQKDLAGRVCLTLFSDHGEEFFEHGEKGHGHNLFETLIHVVLFSWWPGRIEAGREVEPPVSLADLAPTYLSLAGGTPPAWTQGRRLDGVLLRGDEPPARPLFGSLFFRGHSMLYALSYPLKLVNDTQAATMELYNLEADPGERVNLYESAPEVANSQFASLQSWWQESLAIYGRFRPAPPPGEAGKNPAPKPY